MKVRGARARISPIGSSKPQHDQVQVISCNDLHSTLGAACRVGLYGRTHASVLISPTYVNPRSSRTIADLEVHSVYARMEQLYSDSYVLIVLVFNAMSPWAWIEVWLSSTIIRSHFCAFDSV